MLSMLIEEKGITQKELAEKICLAPQTVNNYVKGHRLPDLDTLEKLCDFFGVTSDYLLGRSLQRRQQVSDADALLVSAYHAASDRDREIVDRLLGLGEQNKNEKAAVG